tara:strand:- start:10 stop:1440 length:1431 start_codon:yes stop_codon:yes gene_type:complete
MVAILGANSVSGEYEVSNSLRFNDDDSPYLNKTTGTATNTRIFTYSVWVKRGNLGDMNLFNGDDGSDGNNNFDAFYFRADHKIFLYGYQGGDRISIVTNRVFRDVSAWYHLVLSCDTTQSSANDRIKLYVNGVQETSFSPHTQPSQNMETYFNGNSIRQQIGRYPDSNSLHFDGYMSEINFVDGQQLLPTSFGEFDNNGVWKPIEYTGTYGNNGFFMEFKQTGTSQNSSGIGADTSGNDNHFAVNNLASTDVTEDTCTNNFCTFNPIDTPQTNPTLSEGNVKLATQASPAYTFDVASFGLQQGKWYWEIKCSGAYDDDYHMVGIASTQPTAHNQELGYFTNDYGLYGGGGSNSLRYGATFYSYGNAINNNDIVGVALDLDNNRLYFSINGTFQNSSDPANGTNPISITDPSSTDRGFYFPAVCFLDGSNSATYEGNWGNPSFSISSGNNDGLYGNFEYSVPSGYYALCTKRLAEFG